MTELSDVDPLSPTYKGGMMTGVNDPEPDPIDLVHELREALGWPVVALPISPQQAWEQALAEVRRLRHSDGTIADD